MRVIEGIKEILGSAPGQLVLDVLMKVLFDSGIGLFVIALQCQEIVAALGLDLVRDGRLTSHRIDSHNTAFDGEQLQEFRNSGDLIGLRIRFDLAHDEATLIGTPSREHMQRGRSCRSIKRRFHCFAIERDECPLGELRYRLGPRQKALLKALGIEAGKDPAERIMGGDPMRQGEEGLEPGALALAKEFHILESFPARQECAQGNDEDIEEVVLLRPLNARVL